MVDTIDENIDEDLNMLYGNNVRTRDNKDSKHNWSSDNLKRAHATEKIKQISQTSNQRIQLLRLMFALESHIWETLTHMPMFPKSLIILRVLQVLDSIRLSEHGPLLVQTGYLTCLEAS